MIRISTAGILLLCMISSSALGQGVVEQIRINATSTYHTDASGDAGEPSTGPRIGVEDRLVLADRTWRAWAVFPRTAVPAGSTITAMWLEVTMKSTESGASVLTLVRTDFQSSGAYSAYYNNIISGASRFYGETSIPGWMNNSRKTIELSSNAYTQFQNSLTTFNVGFKLMDETKPDIELFSDASRPITLVVNYKAPSVTIKSSPINRTFTEGGNTYTTDSDGVMFNWPLGSTHTVNWASPQAGTTGVRYAFSQWDDGGSQNRTFTVAAGNPIYTANFTTQYLLTTSSNGGGSLSPQSGWYNTGTTVPITASPNSCYTVSWSGVSGGNSTSILMDGPKTVIATFNPVPPALGISSTSLSIGPGEVNISYDITVTNTSGCGNLVFTASSNQPWLFVGQISGNTIPLGWQANTGTSSRTGVVTVTANGATGSPKTFTLTQAGQNTLTISQPSLTIASGSGSSGSFSINSNTTWNVSSNQSWLNVVPSSGSNNNTITVTATSANPTTSARTATVTITGSNAPTRTLTVTQEGSAPALFLDLSTGSLALAPSSGSTATFGISSNTTWSITDDGSWLNVSHASGSNNNTITVTAASENASTTSRSATVTVSGTGVSPARTVTVTQSGTAPFLTLAPTEVTLGQASGSTISFSLSSNTTWTITDDGSWLNASHASGSNSVTITLTASSANTATTSRSATVTVSGTGVSPPRTVTVTQSGTAPFLTLAPTEVTLGQASGSTISFSLSSNTTWTITDDGAWLNVSHASGTNSVTITLTASSANTATTSRSATVIISGTGVSPARTLTVTQSGTASFLTLAPTEVTLGQASGSTTTFTLSSNTTWSITDDGSWLSVSQASGTGNATITLTASSANTATTSRSAIVTVVGTGVNTQTLTVTQSGSTAPVLSCSTTSITFTSSAGAVMFFDITSNTNWTITVDASWLTVTPTSGSNNAVITISTSSDNTGTTSRTATVTMSASGVPSVSFPVTQAAFTGPPCSGSTTLTASTGSFSDGSGASNYVNNLNCSWLIQVPGASSITVAFTEFSLEQGFDYVTLYDGTTTSAPMITQFTGTTMPPNVMSNSGNMLVVFTSDVSNTNQGWSATYFSTGPPTGCSGTTNLTAASGVVSDGSGPNNYAVNLDCYWLIQPPGVGTITLTFASFSTELNYDYVRIYDGATTGAPLIGSFHGTGIPASVTSTGGSMLIRFNSDTIIPAAGWTATYTSTLLQVPQVTTSAISGVSQTSASGGGSVTSASAVTARGVCWSTSLNPTMSNAKTTNGTGTGSFTSSLTSLLPNTLYHVRAYATNIAGTGYGQDITFTTTALGVPVVTTTSITSITRTGASGGGSVTADNGAVVAARGIAYGTTSNPTIAGTTTLNGTGTGSFTSSLSGLTPGTTYHVRAYATNAVGTSYGSNVTFTATPASIAVVSTDNIINITATSLRTGGNITDDGGAVVSERGVVWSTSSNPTLVDDDFTFNGQGQGSFTSDITGLEPATTYYVRAYAKNSAGVAYGTERTLTTLCCWGTTTFTTTTGTFTDGSGSQSYANNTDCKWVIEPPGANSITLTFSSFNTEPSYDRVRIYSGTTTSGTLLRTLSGSIVSETVTVAASGVLLHFISDNGVQGGGWTVSYEADLKNNQAITFNEIARRRIGDAAFALQATASSDLPVSFEVDNSNVATVNGATVSIVGAGSTIIRARQVGNTAYHAAPAIERTLTVDKANQSITFPTISNKAYGSPPFGLVGTSTSGLPLTYTSSRTDIVTITGGTATIVGAGSVVLTATQAGNANFNAATATSFTLVVGKASQDIAFNQIADVTMGGAPLTLVATSSSTLPVTFTAETANLTIAGNKGTLVNAGKATIIGSQAGNTNYQAATSVKVEFCINPAKPVISFTQVGNLYTLNAPAGSRHEWYFNGNVLPEKNVSSLSSAQAGEYKVKVFEGVCGSEISEAFVLIVTGLESENKGGLVLFPNPVDKLLIVEGWEDENGLEVFDVLGRKIDVGYERVDGKLVMNVSELAGGKYLIRCKSETSSRMLQFIKR